MLKQVIKTGLKTYKIDENSLTIIFEVNLLISAYNVIWEKSIAKILAK
ncbi:MAG: hypothetical protein QXS06_00685 [Desulfurococcaceae archaeon]